MADPQIAARYVLDRCTPPEIREELERRLGAREGDSITLLSDGTVGLARIEEGAAASRLTRLLWPVASPPPRARGRGHLRRLK
jgi:hypothetical protein